jgi:hypothetical protein
LKHRSTREVYAYWDALRGDRAAPERGDIDPAAIRHALGDTFMLAADFVDQLRLRLAGTRVCALFAREIKGEAFTTLWSEASCKPVEDLLTVVAHETVGAVAGVSGHTAGADAVDLEMLLLPLADHARIRALGVLAALAVPYWIGSKPVVELELGTLRHVGPEVDRVATLRFAGAPARSHVRRGLVVYTGGRPPNERIG